MAEPLKPDEEAPVQDDSVQILSQASEEEPLKRSSLIELGDYLKVHTNVVQQGEAAVAGEGYVYYRDTNFIKYLKGDTVVTLPLDESGSVKEELGIDRIQFKKADWRAKEDDFELTEDDSFLKIFDFKDGDLMQAFKDGKAGPTYRFTSVNYGDDIGILEQVDSYGQALEQPREVNFNFTGIPIANGFDYDVIKKVQLEQADELEKGQGEPAPAKESREASAENFEEIAEPLIKHLGEIPPPKINKILVELEEREIIYESDDQRQEMMRDLLSLETPERQKRDTVLVDLHRFVELLLNMRDEVVKYDSLGKPDKEPKETSATFLSDLLHSPLVKPVIDAIKNFYVDLDESGRDELMEYKKLSTVVEPKFKTLGEIQKYKFPTSDYTYVTEWQDYVNRFMRSWYSTSKNQISFKRDSEFFRLCSPEVDFEADEVSGCGQCDVDIPGFERGLPRFKKGAEDKNIPLSIEKLSVLSMSIGRGLATLMGRPTTRDLEPILNAETAGIHHYILFPYSVANSLGPARSGRLLTDSLRSQMIAKSIRDILIEKDGVQVVPTADTIIAIAKKDTCENIQIDAYLKSLPVWNVREFADFEDAMVALGLNKYELNEEQLDTLKTLLTESIALHNEQVRTLATEARIQDRPPIINRSFETDQESAAKIMDLFKTVIQGSSINNFARLPAKYRQIDFVRLNYLVQNHQDLIDAILGGNDISITRESNRYVRNEFQVYQNEFILETLREKTKGKPPQPNPCPHVNELEKIRRVRDKSERMKLLYGFILKNKGQEQRDFPKTKQHRCRKCKKSLICDHEYKLLYEFLHPQDSRLLHKEILLNYMGGQFNGQFICRYCGQSIQSIEYDTSMEFDDNGRPMMGRAILKDGQDPVTALFDKSINLALGTANDTEEFDMETDDISYKKFKTGQLIGLEDNLTAVAVGKKIYECARRIYSALGVNPPRATYETVVKTVNGFILQMPNREVYTRGRLAREEKGEEDPCAGGLAKDRSAGVAKVDYYVYLNRRIILYTAAFIFVDIQTHRPSYLIQYTEKTSFEGYPFVESTDESNLDGVKYLAYVLGGIITDEEPWSLTQWHFIEYLPKRREYIERCLLSLFGEMRTTALVKTMIQDKEAFVESNGGRRIGDVEETLPGYFLPEQIGGGDKVKAAAGAADAGSSKALIRQIHQEAATHNIFKKSPFSETTCCLANIREETYWQAKKILGTGTKPPVGPRGSRFAFPYVPRPSQLINPEVPPTLYPRVFLKVCFRGERTGLPHEPGLTGKCPHCEFTFPALPDDQPLPDPPIKAKEYEAWILKRDEAITSTLVKAVTTTLKINGDINKELFQGLLDTTHRHYEVEFEVPVKPSLEQTRTRFFSKLSALNLYSSWVKEISEVIANFKELTPNPTSDAQTDTLKPLEKTRAIYRAAVTARITEDYRKAVDEMCKLSSVELKTQLYTYFIVPINRGLKDTKAFQLSFILKDYQPMSDLHIQQVKTEILQPHFDYSISKPKEMKFEELFKKENTDLVARAKLFVKQLEAISSLLSDFHLSGLGLTNEYFRVALNRILVLSAIGNYVSLQGGAAQGNVTESIVALQTCIRRYSQEALKYTDEQVRDGIAARDEIERQSYLKKLSKLNPDEKRVEMTKKRLGLGEWAVGGTKLIYKYNKDFYDLEREKDEAAGIENFRGNEDTGYEYGGVDASEWNPQGEVLDDAAGDYGYAQEAADDY
jgi:hypothetical protein